MIEHSYRDIIEKINTNKKNGYTNCFLTRFAIEAGMDNKRIKAFSIRDALVLIECTEQINVLYYFCNHWDWIKESDQILTIYNEVVLNITGKKDDVEAINRKLQAGGLFGYKYYQRMRRKELELVLPDTNIAKVYTSSDLKPLKELMSVNFDKKSDTIPTDEELSGFIEKQQIIYIEKNKEIAGFIIFEDKGKTSYIRMVCVNEGFQRQGIGNELMAYYFHLHKDYKGFTLWVDKNNRNALHLYKKWGYLEENLENYIYVLN